MTRAEWIEEYAGMVPVVIRRIPHEMADTEDLISEGMIGLIHAVDGYDPQRGVRFATYASKCIINSARNYYRKKSHQREIPIEESTYEADDLAMEEAKRKEEARAEKKALLEALMALKYRERLLIDLHYGLNGAELSQQEIAEFFGVSQSSISREEKRILKQLKKELL